MRIGFGALWLGCVASVSAAAADSAGIVSIRLEQKQGDTAKAVPQDTVFHNGEILRFRLTSRIPGYLYVVDQGTSGETDTLFPAAGAAEGDNRIEPNRVQVIPANGDGWFEVSGPAGFDVLYFVVSASPMRLPPAAPGKPAPETKPGPILLPRCDDAIFKEKGDCVDHSAGITPLAPGAAVPRELVPLARSASRDIILTDDGDSTAIRPAPEAAFPIIYTFRLAHRE
jgi:hypothetical protein